MTRPNLLVIMSDDHAQWAAGCYGARELHTPALDHLAAGGLRMANAFTPSPVCSPARASFFTGLLPSQHGIHDWLWYNVNARSAAQRNALAQQPSLAGQQTLAQRLSAAGYHCGLSGKWHCGDDDLPQPGFAYWDALRRNTVPRDGGYSVDGQLIERSGWHSDIITDNALRFLRQRESDQPFFLFVGYIGTHSPWRGHPQRLVERYRDASFADIPQDAPWPFGRPAGEAMQQVSDRREALAQYYAAVTHIDEGVGRLLDELEAQGLREDTLVVYTADHGLNCSQHGLWGKGNATRPPNMLEESIRVPLLLNWPGHVSAGHTSEHFVDHCDLHATLLDLAGPGRKRKRGARAQLRAPAHGRAGAAGLAPGPGRGIWPDAHVAHGTAQAGAAGAGRGSVAECSDDDADIPAGGTRTALRPGGRPARDARSPRRRARAGRRPRRATGRLLRAVRRSCAQRPAGAPGPASQLQRSLARAAATVAPGAREEVLRVLTKKREGFPKRFKVAFLVTMESELRLMTRISTHNVIISGFRIDLKKL